jgi:MOSC domain-containing protein YiiM
VDAFVLEIDSFFFLPWSPARSRLFQGLMARLQGIAVRIASRAPMVEFRASEVTADAGVEGEVRGNPGPRQVTVLSEEAWYAACEDAEQKLPWTTRRANLLVSEITFGPDSPGHVLVIGDTRLEITMETAPCNRMDEAHVGLKKALIPDWRGGVCCRVLSGGLISVGDTVHLIDA